MTQMTDVMKRLPIADDIFVVMYVAKDGVTEEQMLDHYHRIMKRWLKDNQVTKTRCWIARHDGLLSIILEVDVYVGDWSEIADVHKLYRSDSEKVLMKAQLVCEGNIDEI